MTISKTFITLRNFETDCLFGLESRPVGSYFKKMLIYSSGFLSSIYIKSIDAGATIKVNYYDTTTGAEDVERFDLTSHTLITDADVGKTFRISVSNLHNKPIAEVIITGGNVEFGIYITALDVQQGSLTLAEGASTATTENSAVGNSLIYNETLVLNTNLVLPAVAGNFINSFIVDNIGTNNLEFSFNGVAPFYVLTPNNNFAWTCQATKQITLKGDGNIQAIINYSGVS